MKAQIAIMLSDIDHDLGKIEKSLEDLKAEFVKLSAFFYDPKNIEAQNLVCEYTGNCCFFKALKSSLDHEEYV